MTPWQVGVQRAIGAGLCCLAVLLALGLLSHRVPDELQGLGVIARLTEGMRVYMLLAAALLSLGLAALGAR